MKQSLSLPVSVIIPSVGNDKLFNILEGFEEKIDELIIVLNNYDSKKINKIKLKFNSLMLNNIKNKQLIVADNCKNIGQARNIGIEKSKNNLLVFLDDDLIVEKDTVYNLYKTHLKNKNSVIKGVVKYVSKLKWNKLSGNDNEKNNFFKNFKSKLTINCREINTTKTSFAFNPNMMVPRKIFKKLKSIDNYYFAEYLEGEDYEFHLRLIKLGVNIKSCEKSKVYHYPDTIKKDFSSARRYGRDRKKMLLMNKSILLEGHERYNLKYGLLLVGKHLVKMQFLSALYQLIWQFSKGVAYMRMNKK